MAFAAIDPTAFSIFGIEIKWYAILIVTGIVIAVLLASREAVKVGLREDDIYDFILWGLPIALIGARLYYVLFEWSFYKEHPSQILAFRNGGLAIYGGLIAGALVIYFFTRHRFISPWLFLDVAAPGVLLAQSIGRWGNFMNQEAFGDVTTRAFLDGLHLPRFIINQMYIDGAYRQPTFLYESLWNLIGFIALLMLRRKKNLHVGEIALGYVIWYALGRFFIEGMRTDSLMLTSELRVSQILSALLFVGSISLVIYRRKKIQPPLYNRISKELIK